MPRAAPSPANKDPLLRAVWDHLPPSGETFPHSKRESWIEMLRNALDVVHGPATLQSKPPDVELFYGGEASGSMSALPVAGTVAPRYVIEPNGTASCNGRQLDPGDIPPGTVLYDYRPQPVDEELDPINWKTVGYKKLPLPPGAIVRAATEPWTTPSAANGSAEV